jgi:hypothetical protein
LETWILPDGLKHREYGPAIIYNNNGRITSVAYYQNGKPHREDGPAIIFYGEDGSIIEEYWHVAGRLHRTDGPATFRLSGNAAVFSYYLEGKKYTKEQWEQEVAQSLAKL